MNYEEMLKDPRWQKKRLEILDRQDFTCQGCDNKKNTLHVHHLRYILGHPPWDYEDKDLAVLCSKCHEFLHCHDLQLYHLRIINRLKPSSSLITMGEILNAMLAVEYSVIMKMGDEDVENVPYIASVLEDMEAMKLKG